MLLSLFLLLILTFEVALEKNAMIRGNDAQAAIYTPFQYGKRGHKTGKPRDFFAVESKAT